MLNPNTNGLVTVSINNIVSSGAGFGVVMGTGSNCIISSRVLYAADLRAGDLIRCKLIENPATEFRHRTPYMVSYVDPNATAALRIAVTGGQSVHQVATAPQPPEQLNLPFEEPLTARATALPEALTEWNSEPSAAPDTEPKRETSVELRARVDSVLNSGGMWTTRQLRDRLWPDDEFGSDDCRYKMLTNALRDVHKAGKVFAFGRRGSMDGLLTSAHYTRFPENVRITWAGK